MKNYSIFKKYIYSNAPKSIELLVDYFITKDLFLFKNKIARYLVLRCIKTCLAWIPISFSSSDSLVLKFKNSQTNNAIELHEHNNSYRLYKLSNPDNINREIDFYSKHKNRKGLQLTPVKRVTSTKVTMPFIESETLKNSIYVGKYDKLLLRRIAKLFSTKIKEFYGSDFRDKTLIHGDMGLSNVLFYKNRFHIIDYSDSFEFFPEYDLYVFMSQLDSLTGSNNDLSYTERFITSNKIPIYRSLRKERMQKKHSISD